MVASSDTWFRPSDICVAPDGSVFIADWYDPGVGGHGMGDTTRGPIFRLTPKGHQGYHNPPVHLDSKDGLVAALGSPALSVRYMAMAKLRGMDSAAFLEALQGSLTQNQNAVLRARALWQLGCQYQAARKRLETGTLSEADGIAPLRQAIELHVRGKAFVDPDPRFRILAIRILRDF